MPKFIIFDQLKQRAKDGLKYIILTCFLLFLIISKKQVVSVAHPDRALVS